jgi:nucleotide-binding universal stress UspA family protein
MDTALPKRILLAVETAELAEPALLTTASLASSLNGVVDLVHVWEPIPFTPPDAAFHEAGAARSYREIATTDGEQELRKVSERAVELGLAIGRKDVREGSPAQTIVELAKAADSELIVLTNHQRRGVSRWMQGSVSQRVAQLSPCPVLVVPLHDATKDEPSLR